MNILILKLYSLFVSAKEGIHAHLLQYIVTTYKTRPIIRKEKTDSKVIDYINIVLFSVYFIVRIVVVAFFLLVHFFKILLVFDRGLARSALSLAILAFLLFELTLTSVYFYLSGDVDPVKLSLYQDLHRFKTATAVRDKHGNLIGAISNPLRNNVPAQRPGSLFVDKLPAIYWDVLKANGNKYLSFENSDIGLLDILLLKNKTYKGINIVEMFTPFHLFQKNIALNQSGLINQIVKNIQRTKYVENKHVENKCSTKLFDVKFLSIVNKTVNNLCGKTEELKAARHLFPYLAKNNGLEFKRWAGMHIPMVNSGKDVSGLRALSETVFNKSMGMLNEAEQAILAVSSFEGNNEQSWSGNVEQAIKGVEIAYGESQPDKAQRIIQALKLIKPPKPSKVPSVYSRYLASLSAEKRKQYQHLAKRSSLFINNFNPLLVKQLKSIYLGIGKQKVITDIVITLPIIENQRFKRSIEFALQNISLECPSCYRVEFEDSSHVGSNQSPKAVVKILVSDEQGKIVRYYSKNDSKNKSKNESKNKSKNESRDGAKENAGKRSIAGIAKLPASIFLASLGDLANTKYCNQKYTGLKNDIGPLSLGINRCRNLKKRGHSFTFKDTMAASRDLPLIYALTQKHNIPPNTFLSLYSDFNLEHLVPKGLEKILQSSEQLAYDLTLGNLKSNILDVHKFTHKITQTLFNSEFETEPYTIDQYLVANFGDFVEEPHAGALAAENKIQKYIKFSSTKKVLREILRSPIYHKEGVLRSFKNIPSVNFLFAQSGTAIEKNNTVTNVVKDKWVVGAFKVRGKTYSFLIYIGTQEKDKGGLGNRISHRMLMYPLMNEIIKSLR